MSRFSDLKSFIRNHVTAKSRGLTSAFLNDTYSTPQSNIVIYCLLDEDANLPTFPGSKIWNILEIFAPIHRSRGMVHVQWLQTHCQWWTMGDVVIHNWRMDRHSVFSPNLVHELTLTRHVWLMSKIRESNPDTSPIPVLTGLDVE